MRYERADRFADPATWDRLETGETRFTGVACWLRCRIAQTIDVPGATIIVAQVLEAGGVNADPDTAGLNPPLVYHSRNWHALGEGSLTRAS